MEEELREQCRHSTRRVLAQRGWELVQNETAFVEDVLAEVQTRLRQLPPVQHNRRPLEKIIEDATVNRYGHIWHAACGAEGTLRQWQAFRELHRYLYSIALYRAGHDEYVAEESTQEALINVWQHLHQVRDPGSFMRWAGRIVSNEVTKRLKQARKGKEISEIDLQPREGAKGTRLRRIDDRPGLFPASQKPKMTGEIRARVESAIRGCLRRSKRQQTVIVGFFLKHRGFKEMADEVGSTLQNVRVLKTRALASLRKCKEFLEALEELL